MSDPTNELTFQNDVIAEMVAGGWKRGNPEKYERTLALYPEDVLGFVQDTQPEQWQKFCGLYPSNPEQKFQVVEFEGKFLGLEKSLQPRIDHHLETSLGGAIRFQL